MNLWVKRITQWTLLMSTALFFLCCEEEASQLGYPGKKRFDVSFIDIPIESSVLLLDSVKTANYKHEGDVSRFLIGSYEDPTFGTITSSVFTQFYYRGAIDGSLDQATVDSVTLKLNYDYYQYGQAGESTEGFAVYELSEALDSALLRKYTNNSSIPYEPTPLGETSVNVRSAVVSETAAGQSLPANQRPAPLILKIPLDVAFGERILNRTVGVTTADAYKDSLFNLFVEEFKGIAIVPTQGEKILGFQPQGSMSKIMIHFHIEPGVRDSLELDFVFGVSDVTTGFSRIQADRSGTALDGLNAFHEDFYPGNDMRYIQAGTGVITKLDFNNFFEFADANPDILINSAELLIADVEPATGELTPPPTRLVMRVLNDENRPRRYETGNTQDSLDIIQYNTVASNGAIVLDFADSRSQRAALVDDDRAFTVATGSETGQPLPFEMAYNVTDKQYRNYMTAMAQNLLINTPGKTRFRYFALYPSSPQLFKSVNQVAFHKDNIRLRVFYTKPANE